MKQEDLIVELDTLNYNELRMAVGVGVPGDAQQFTRDKLKLMKEKARQAIENNTNFTSITTTVDFNSGGEDPGKSGIQTSESK
jgi:hypothetical protein